MISISFARRWQRPLYLFVKPPKAMLPALARLRARLGIDGSRYAADRLHSTFVPLGEATDTSVAIAREILGGFHAEPFDVAFDRVEGSTLKPRKNIRGPGIFQRALTQHFAASGFALPEYRFGLHLNLDYGTPSNRRMSIEPLAWTVDEILLVESVRGHVLHGRHSLSVCQYALAL